MKGIVKTRRFKVAAVVLLAAYVLVMAWYLAMDAEKKQTDSDAKTIQAGGGEKLDMLLETVNTTQSEYEFYDFAGYEDDLRIVFFQIGKADSVLLMTPDKTVLIDTGEDDDAAEITDFILRSGKTKIDRLILTNFNKNNIGSFQELYENIPIGEIYVPDYTKQSDAYANLLQFWDENNITVTRVDSQTELAVGDTQLTLLPAEKTYGNDNNYSMAVAIARGDASMLLASDIESGRMEDWLETGLGEYDVLKAPNHGDYNDFTEEFLQQTNPQIAVIADSEKNPAKDKFTALLDRTGVETYETKEGNVYLVGTETGFTAMQPAAATAEAEIALSDSGITVNGDGATANGSVLTIASGGTYTLAGTLSDGEILVNTKAAVTLRLNGVNITNTDGAAIKVVNADACVVELADGSQNNLTDGTAYAESDEAKGTLFSNDDLEITGTGVLTVTANTGHGIVSDDSLTVTSGVLNITTKEKDGLHANDAVVINGGAVTISAADDGIHADEQLTVNSGEIVITQSYEGLEAEVITINDGSIHVTATDDGINAAASGSGGETEPQDWGGNQSMDGQSNSDEQPSADGQPDARQQNFPDNKTTPTENTQDDSDTDQNADRKTMFGGNGGNAGTGGFGGMDEDSNASVTINGGYVYLNADGDGLDSNGNVTITDGIVIVNGPTNNGNGALDYGGSLTMEGGLLVAAGSSGMAQSVSDGQNAIMVGFSETQQAGSVVRLAGSTGKTILAFAPAKQYQNVVICSPEITQGETYTVYAGAAGSGTQQDGVYEDATGGTKLGSVTVSTVSSTIGTTEGMNGMGGNMGGNRGGGTDTMPDGDFPTDGNFPQDGAVPDRGTAQSQQSQ